MEQILIRRGLSYQTFEAGFVATVFMLAIFYAAPLAGLLTFDMAALFASDVREGLEAVLGSGAWWLAFVSLFVFGTYLIPTLYGATFFKLWPSYSFLKGIAWGATLWLLMMILILPALGAGFFGHYLLNVDGRWHFSSLLGFLVYGAVFGWMRERVSWELGV
jgi:hypothetical protein